MAWWLYILWKRPREPHSRWWSPPKSGERTPTESDFLRHSMNVDYNQYSKQLIERLWDIHMKALFCLKCQVAGFEMRIHCIWSDTRTINNKYCMRSYWWWQVITLRYKWIPSRQPQMNSSRYTIHQKIRVRVNFEDKFSKSFFIS
jgi:hypothetical protein